jgi:hypothetical protein
MALQPAAAQQPLHGGGRAQAPFHGRGAAALDQFGRGQQLQAGLAGQLGQRLVQRLGGDVEINAGRRRRAALGQGVGGELQGQQHDGRRNRMVAGGAGRPGGE